MNSKTYRNALPAGYKLQWYEIKSVLGQGGFGITYLATDLNLHREVAIKEFLPAELAMRESDLSVHPLAADRSSQYHWGLQRFIAEARTLARFRHPSIVPVQAVFEENNTGYMVMNYEHGQSLRRILEDKKTMSEPELLRILMPILNGLELVHIAGFIHRDLKPDNIFIHADGSPVLLDFGSARQAFGEATNTLTSMVSPGYAPYEQYHSRGDAQGPWTDIYGMGATLYRAVTGKSPPAAIDRSKAIIETGRDIYIPATEIGKGRYSQAFLAAIDHALKFRTADRPQLIQEWRRELEGAESAATLEIKLSPLELRTAPGTIFSGRRARAGRYNALLLLLLLFAAAAYWGYENRGPLYKYGTVLLAELQKPEVEKTGPQRSAITGENERKHVDWRQQEINNLLLSAADDLRMGRLVEPAGDNALEKYTRILVLAPGNRDARNGRDQIVKYFVDAAERVLAAHDFAQAGAYLDKAEAIDPDSSVVQAGRAHLQDLRTQQERLSIEEDKKRLAEQQLELQKQHEEEKRLQLETQKQKEEKLRQEEQERLQQEARRQEAAEEKQRQEELQKNADYHRLLYESGQLLGQNKIDAAITGFKQAQAIAPDGREARSGLERAQTLKAQCQKITGQWNWFNGGVTTFFPDGRVQGEHRFLPGNQGTWECSEPAAGKFIIRWQEGGWINRMILSTDGERLSGTNQKGEPVSGMRRH